MSKMLESGLESGTVSGAFPKILYPDRSGFPIYSALFLLLVFFAFSRADSAQADENELFEGAAVVTTFSGLISEGNGEDTIDRAGIAVRVLDLSRPGSAPAGKLIDPNELHFVRARDVGQVFALAVDGETPTNIYVAATSAYGLFRNADNSDWAQGMWGSGGGPGTIYRLNADDDYSAEIFARVSLDGRFNTGAGLGGIAFDVSHRQLFVSDLETGMVHRFGVRGGSERGIFDHGVDGRTGFRDVESGDNEELDGVPFNSRSGANIERCGAGRSSAAAARFMANPNCWNFAPAKRRVWALAYRQTEEGGSRLFYSVWGSSSFGEPAGEASGADGKNSIWSVGINSNGSFNAADVRREFVMPPFYVSRQDRADFGDSHPVTSIEFLEDRVMLVAERGMHLGRRNNSASAPATIVGAARVLRFVQGRDGRWVAEGRYDIGASDRENEDPPHLRANGAGGIALGYGYNANGKIEEQVVDETLWVTGSRLCDEDFPCQGASGSDQVVHGLQGLPMSVISDLTPVEAFLPYPESGPATPDDTTGKSYFVSIGDASTGLQAGDIGDVVFVKTQGEGALENDSPQPPPPPPAPPQVAHGPFDLAVDKSGPGECLPGERCIFDIDVTNSGRSDYAGPIYLSDSIEGGLSLVVASPQAWACIQSGPHILCWQENVTLAPGQSLSLRLDFRVPGDISRRSVNNCVEFGWLGLPGREQVRAVQFVLKRRGFNPGVADGVPGRRTAAAIRDAEAALGLPGTGEISDDLLVGLFGQDALATGDADDRNDKKCVAVGIDFPEPVHSARISAFHRDYRSSFHESATSRPINVHNPALSNFHLRFRSSMHDGRTTRPVPIHRNQVSGFHQNWGSSLHETGSSRHATGLSAFHDRFSSGQHDANTSHRRGIHRNQLSRFHDNFNSRLHSTNNSSHRTGLSQFHSRFRSSVHDRNTSIRRP